MKILKQRDILVLACVLAVAALLYFCMPNKKGSIAEIEYDGNRVAEVHFAALGENEVKTFEINGVTIKIDREGAHVAASICKGQVCVHTGKISKAGQTAVCLPQRVSVRITGNAPFDGITG